MRTFNVIMIAILMGCFQNGKETMAQMKNGFDIGNALIPVEEIVSGGPPRDGIPAIDHPKFVPASDADFLKPDDRVLGIVRNGIARAYPIRIMNWHEIVNNRFGDEPVVVTYCPLCGSGVAYLGTIDGQLRTFGVSGLLYNNDVLLYDRETESLWSQILSKTVSGPSKGRKLEMIPISHTTWSGWKERYPGTQVLSTDTGYRRDYGRDPYAGYENSEQIIFPLSNNDNRYHPKEWVVGVEVNNRYIAFPFSELEKLTGPETVTFNGEELNINFDSTHKTATITSASGEELPQITLFWFAWAAFHPDTEVYTSGENPSH